MNMTTLALILLLQADPREEVRRALPEAASLPSHEWTSLQAKPMSIEEASRRGLFTLTFALLALPLNADIDLDFAPEKEVRPSDLRDAIGKKIVSCLQKEYIKDVTCAAKDGTATGTVTAEIPKFGRLSVEYTAKDQGVTWKIIEFRLPKSGMTCACDVGGNWRVSWATPKATTLSLVYSFGRITCFGRAVYDAGEDKWEALDKIFAERESIAGSSLILSGGGSGWTWGTVKGLVTRAKKVSTIRFRSTQGLFEWTRGKPAPEGTVRLHLCGSKKLAEGHVKEADKHAAAIRKAAEDASFGEETWVWAGDATEPGVILHHPMSDDKVLGDDRKALAKFVRSFPMPPCAVIDADGPVMV